MVEKNADKNLKLNNNHNGTISVTLSRGNTVIEQRNISTLEFYDRFADKDQLITDYTNDAFENGAFGVNVDRDNGSVFAAYGVNDDGSFYGYRIEADIDKVTFSEHGGAVEYDRAIYKVERYETETLDNARGQKVVYNPETKEFYIRTGTKEKDIKYLKPEKVFASDGNLNYDKEAAIRKNFEKRHKVDKLVSDAGNFAQNHPAAVAGGILLAKKMGEKASDSANINSQPEEADPVKTLQEMYVLKKGVSEFGENASKYHEDRIRQYKDRVESKEQTDIFVRRQDKAKNKQGNSENIIDGGRSIRERRENELKSVTESKDVRTEHITAEKNKSKDKDIDKNDIKRKDSKLDSKLDKLRGGSENTSARHKKTIKKEKSKTDKALGKAAVVATTANLAQSDNVARDSAKLAFEFLKGKTAAALLGAVGGGSVLIILFVTVIAIPVFAIVLDIFGWFMGDFDFIDLNPNEQLVSQRVYTYLINEQGIDQEMAFYMTAGIVGNLAYESDGMMPNRVEYGRLHVSDETYTSYVNSGYYSRNDFASHYFGYGIAQWTASSRRRGLYDYAKHYADEHHSSFLIDSLTMQTEYILIETFPEGVDGYTCSYHEYQNSVVSKMQDAINGASNPHDKIEAATTVWMEIYENPDRSLIHMDKRLFKSVCVYMYIIYAVTGEHRAGGSGSWQWPVPSSHTISSPYGPRWGGTHSGIDIACPEGSLVIASNGGTAYTYVDGSYHWSTGNTVIVDCGDGTKNCYYHLSGFIVNNGDTVTAGQPIAYSGNTGNSTGPHLHFGVYINGVLQDPMNFLQQY